MSETDYEATADKLINARFTPQGVSKGRRPRAALTYRATFWMVAISVSVPSFPIIALPRNHN